MSDIGAILDERGKRYGRFMDVAATTRNVKKALQNSITEHKTRMSPDQEEALCMICSKLARIVNGDPNHIDSWDDIAGYAMLVADRLRGRAR